MGWHAKPLPKDMAEMVMKELQSRIMNSSKHLYPPAPVEDSPPVSLRNIRMPSAPSYKAGEKVCRLYTRTDLIHSEYAHTVSTKKNGLSFFIDCHTEGIWDGAGQVRPLQ